MKHVIMLLAILTSLLLSAAVAVGQDELLLIDPADGSTVSATTFLFAWEPAMAITFKLTLKSKDGLQKTSFIVENEVCNDTICATQFSPIDHSWQWRDGIVYKWWVIARDNLGTTSVVSPKFKFTTDLLPDDIVLTAPAHLSTVTNPNVEFMWEPDNTFVFHRVVISSSLTGNVGIDWFLMADACDDDCGAQKSFAGLPNGVYKWKVQGKHFDVAGKASSVTRKFTLALP